MMKSYDEIIIGVFGVAHYVLSGELSAETVKYICAPAVVGKGCHSRLVATCIGSAMLILPVLHLELL